MNALLTTAACAALAAGLAGAPAPAAAQQDDGARAVSPDEYFGTRARQARSQDQDEDAAQGAETTLPSEPLPVRRQDEAADAPNTTQSLNERSLRQIERERDARAAGERGSEDPAMEERLRRREAARRALAGQAATRADAAADTGSVTVSVSGIEEDGGEVFVALQDEQGFAGDGGAYTQVVPADGRRVTVTFNDVAPGDYAAAAFQDTDGDGAVTLERTGPTEPWGLSGDVSGAPRFEDAMFAVESGEEARADVSVDGQPQRQGAADQGAAARADGQARTAASRSDRPRADAADGMEPSDEVAVPGSTAAMDAERDATVTVTVTGLEGRGEVFVALQDEQGFAQDGGAYTQTAQPEGGEAEVVFEGVMPGRYAVAAFQDTDGDGEVTIGEAGPTEPWGFSGEGSGAPSFEAAALDVEGDAEAEVALRPGAEMSDDERADRMMGAGGADERDDLAGAGTDGPDMAMAGRPDTGLGDMDLGAAPAAEASGASALVYRRSASLSEDALTAKDYLGGEMVSADGDQLAKIEDVILNPEGRAQGVVLATGGLFGLGADHYAVNFDRVTPEREGGSLVLRSALTDADVERLRPFDYDAFKQDRQGLLLASQISGAKVAIGRSGDTAEAEDVVMRPDGSVEAVVLGFDGDRLAVPFGQVTVAADGALSVSGAPADMQALARYEGRPGEARRGGLLRRR